MLLTSCREALFHISRIRQLSILAIAMSLQVQGVDSDDDEVEFVGEPACDFARVESGLPRKQEYVWAAYSGRARGARRFAAIISSIRKLLS